MFITTFYGFITDSKERDLTGRMVNTQKMEAPSRAAKSQRRRSSFVSVASGVDLQYEHCKCKIFVNPTVDGRRSRELVIRWAA